MDLLIVKTKQGYLRGKLSKNYKNETFYSFFGIPYATPPLGHLRFKAPQPPQPWEGILDATVEKNGCMAPNVYTKTMEGSEDCLHLNVYTPEIPQNENSKLKPVIVFVYGGAFMVGNIKTELFGPDFLLIEDIVLVLICYRLNALGWSRLEDGSLGVPGNQGIRDVIMALKWVQENIHSFSGDPKNVTLFGASAGGAMVHNIMLLPRCKDLFHKFILHGASALFHWGIGRKDSMGEMAKYLNCPSEVDRDILEFLQKQPIEKIVEARLQIKDDIKPSIQKHFFPVMEDTPNIEEPVIAGEHRKIIAKGEYNKVPMMIGYNSDEGKFFDYQIRNKVKRDKNAVIITDFEEMVPHTLGFKRGSLESRRIAQRTKLFYFNGEDPTIKDRNKFYQMFGDNCYNFILQDTARRHLKTLEQPIYFFKFSVDAKLNLHKKLQGVADLPGPTHCDELCYLFKMSLNPPVEENSVEDLTIRRMVKMWTNFARTGNPNVVAATDDHIDVTWKPIEEGKLHYLNIGEKLSTGVNPDKEGVDFWEEMYNMSPLAKL